MCSVMVHDVLRALPSFCGVQTSVAPDLPSKLFAKLLLH